MYPQEETEREESSEGESDVVFGGPVSGLEKDWDWTRLVVPKFSSEPRFEPEPPIHVVSKRETAVVPHM